MKKILLVSIFFLNLFAVEVMPNWYPSKNNINIISYGDGNSLEEATNNAFLNLKKQNPSITNIDISDIEVIKQEILENHFFVKTKYINLSIIEQLKKSMKKIVFKADDETNKYLIDTKLLKDLNSSFGYLPKIKIDEKYLYFNKKRFLIKHNEFSLLLSEINSNDISLDIKKNLLNNEKYFMKISPHFDGFITLIQISNYKDVEVLFANKILKKDKYTIFPNFKLSDGLEAILQNDVNSSKILTMAIACKEQKDFSKFNSMYLWVSNKKNMLGKLIDEIDDCTYKSVLSTITK